MSKQLAILSPRHEADLIEFLNFSDGLYIQSMTGSQLEAMRDGTIYTLSSHDPENSIIRNLDGIARHRRIFRVMQAIGHHARVLTQAYLLEKRPRYIDKRFGRQSGIVVHLAPDLEQLIDACTNAEIGDKDARKAAARFLAPLRAAASRAFHDACAAYLEALEREDDSSWATPEPVKSKTAVPHRCRSSVVYPCPCRG